MRCKLGSQVDKLAEDQGQRIDFGSQFEGAVHHDGIGMAVGG